MKIYKKNQFKSIDYNHHGMTNLLSIFSFDCKRCNKSKNLDIDKIAKPLMLNFQKIQRLMIHWMACDIENRRNLLSKKSFPQYSKQNFHFIRTRRTHYPAHFTELQSAFDLILWLFCTCSIPSSGTPLCKYLASLLALFVKHSLTFGSLRSHWSR